MSRTDPTAKTVKAVRERDGGRCVRCGASSPLTTQHRVARGMGGTRASWINEPANLVTLCGSGTTGCHGWVEHHPAEARAFGWSVSRYGPLPSEVPVWIHGVWVLLDNDGGSAPFLMTAPSPDIPNISVA